jgi:MFS family permease
MMAPMATTTSNRKKSASSTRATRSTKTTKTASAKAKQQPSAKVTTKSASATNKAVLTPLDRIRSIHISTALVYLVFAGIVAAFVNTAAVAVTLAIQARDHFASESSVVLGSADEVLYNIEPKYLLIASLVVGAIASILLAGKLRNRYEAALNSGSSALKWFLYGISAGLMITFVGLLSGVNDGLTLKLMAGLIIATTILSWSTEKENTGTGQPRWGTYWLAIFTGVLAWLPILGSLIGTTVFSAERFGWHVYAIDAVVLAGSIAVALNLKSNIQVRTPRRVYTDVEARYLRVDLFTKFAVVLITILALQ